MPADISRKSLLYYFTFCYSCVLNVLKSIKKFTILSPLIISRFFFFFQGERRVEVNLTVKGCTCERDGSAARVIQISMDCKCFNYCDKKASLIEMEPICLKMATAVFEVMRAELGES